MKADFLSGIRVCDLTWAGAGPFATKFFSDFGADVIKIETVSRPDSVRLGGPFKDRVTGINRSGYFASRNTCKQSIELNMKTEEGKEILHKLIAKSDIISNNFAYGVMERLGLGYDDVTKINPNIIYLAMPLYATAGPATQMSGVGMSISALSGLMHHTGYDEDHIVGPGTHYPDHAANPCHAAFGVMAALRHRRKTGRGMKVDLSQVESTINFVGPAVVEVSDRGQELEVNGNRSRRDAPAGIFPCAGDDVWCAIEVEGDEQWRALAQVMGQPTLASSDDAATAQGRMTMRLALEQMVSDWTKTRSADEVIAALEQAQVPCARAASSKYLVEQDPQLAARAYWVRIQHKELGNSLYANVPCRVDGERVEMTAPPLFGEHTDSALKRILDLPQSEIERLKEAGVLV